MIGNSTPEDLRVLVHAYLDGELNAGESLAMERAIAADRNLAAEVASVRALKDALQHVKRDAIPAGLARRIDKQFGGMKVAQPGWTALAASVVAAIGLSSIATHFWMQRADDRIYTESANSHLRALLAPAPVDVTSSERHIVKPWFNGKSMLAPKVPDLAAQGFPLVGGRVDVIGGAPVPAVVYTRRLHTISVWASNDVQSSELNRSSTSIKGTNLVVWHADGMSYWAASDLNATELSAFAKAHAEAK